MLAETSSTSMLRSCSEMPRSEAAGCRFADDALLAWTRKGAEKMVAAAS